MLKFKAGTEPYIEAGMIGSWVVMIWSHPSLFATCCLSLLLLLWFSGFDKMRCRERDVRRFSLGARARERDDDDLQRWWRQHNFRVCEGGRGHKIILLLP
jgi:hypothetical protein